MKDLLELTAQFYKHLDFLMNRWLLTGFNACLLINSIECIGMVSVKWP